LEGRILGIDYGRARIGLSLSDPLGITAQPLAVIRVESQKDAVERVAGVVAEHGVERIVLGLPLNMNGTEGPMVGEVRAFAVVLEKKTGLKPVEWDERLTSSEALSALGQGERSWRKMKEKMDAVAAQFLLQSHLDSLSRDGFR